MNGWRATVVCLVLGGLAALAATGKPQKIKRIKHGANAVQYLAFSQVLTPEEQLRHALDRLTFGARPGDLEALRRKGLKKFVEQELSPEKTPENAELVRRLELFESLHLSVHDTYLNYPAPRMIAAVARGKGQLPDDPELRPIVTRLAERYLARKDGAEVKDPADISDLNLKSKLTDVLTPAQVDVIENGKPEQKRELLASLNLPADKRVDLVWSLTQPQRRQLMGLAPVELRRQLQLTVSPENVVASDLAEGKLLRAIYSNRQLAELLDDFWFNHFNVFLNKGGERYLVPTYEREAIRPHVLGKFSDLLLATAKSPAMLFYLDNWQSAVPNGRSKRGLNENYGRELLELHTLGVDGGYTQKDVVEVARCFTGWTIAGPRKGDTFLFDEKMHDPGQKVVLGHVIAAGGGMSDGLQVIEILAHHPSTAQFISWKLARRFVADDPPPSLVNRMAETFRKSDGDLRQVMKTMLSSGEFWSQGAYQTKVKPPFEMVVSAVRATGAEVTSAFPLTAQLQKLGEPLYRKIEPTGYSSANAEWVSSAALLDRMNFGLALANNRVPGVAVNAAQWREAGAQDPMRVARLLLDSEPSVQTRTAIKKMLSEQTASDGKAPLIVAGLAIGSPEFQRH